MVRYMLFSTIFALHQGDVAQLARALDWQSRGRGFESHLLHKQKTEKAQPQQGWAFLFYGVLKKYTLFVLRSQ